MTLREVKDILGEPLQSEESVPGEVWRYGAVSTEENGPRAWAFSVGKPVVVFSESGKVERSFETDDIKAGMSREEVRAVLGEPSARHVLREVVWLHYSLPAESGRSEIRIVGINRESRVSNISSYSTID